MAEPFDPFHNRVNDIGNGSDSTFRSLLHQESERTNNTLRISYPSDLLSKKAHFCELAVLNHVRASESATSFLGDRAAGGVQAGRHSIAAIYLPIPEQFTEGELEQKFNKDASIADAITSLIGENAFLERLGNFATHGFALSQTVPNKGYYVAYERPEFREYEFAWTLSPRNEAESHLIHNITRWLKFFSSPAKKGLLGNNNEGRSFLQGLTLSYPNEFRIRFLHWDGEGEPEDIFFPRPQTGFISSLEINHFNEGGELVGFFVGTRHPVVTVLKMTYTENRLMYKNDFTEEQIFSEMQPQELGIDFNSNPENDQTVDTTTLFGGRVRNGVLSATDAIHRWGGG